MTPSEIETVFKCLPTNRNLDLDGFSAEPYQTFEEKLTPIFLTLFYKIETEGIFSNHMRPLLPLTKLHKDQKKL